eukprot:4635818-Amphidinium_carterae.5
MSSIANSSVQCKRCYGVVEWYPSGGAPCTCPCKRWNVYAKRVEVKGWKLLGNAKGQGEEREGGQAPGQFKVMAGAGPVPPQSGGA